MSEKVIQQLKAALYKAQAEAQTILEYSNRLEEIVANTYQVCGALGAHERILDVLSAPSAATQDQIDAMLPYHVSESETFEQSVADMPVVTVEAVMRLRERAMRMETELALLKGKSSGVKL